MVKLNFASIVYYSLIIFLVFFMIYVFNFLSSNGRECVKQPFLYGAERMEVECNCNKPLISNLGLSGCEQLVFFNSTYFKTYLSEGCKKSDINPYESLNFSSFNFTAQ